jgi:dynein heavy chain
MTNVVSDYLGEKFTQPPPFDLEGSFADSSCTSPLIFILSTGQDPAKELYRLADQMGMNTPDKLMSISLGQGQGPLAENAIREVI